MHSERKCIITLFIYLCSSVGFSVCTIGSTIRFPRQTNTRSCRLPQHPAFGQWSIYDDTSFQIPGNVVSSGTTLEISCQDSYRLEGEDVSTCVRGQWRPKIGKCLRTCLTISDTPFMTATCNLNGRTVEKCAGGIEGTVASFSCAPFYEDQGLKMHPHRLCSNGSWGQLPECVPVCGKKSSDPRLLVGADDTERGEYPWQIALYTLSDKTLLCGGSLLNERVVLTAAHCVTNSDGELLPKELYVVVAGKYFRKYDHTEDLNKAQFSPISDMYIPRQYRGEHQNYFGDIAMLVTEKTFVLSQRVQPVCVDWGYKRFQASLQSTTNQHGYVAGWGFTFEYKNPSSVLKVLKAPIIDERECYRRLPSTSKNLMTDDKLCAGFVNSSASACKGDSGGGLVYEFEGRFYLVGIVSVSPQAQTQEGGCNSQQYTLYTNVSYYTDRFILDKETRFKPSVFGDLNCNYDPDCGILPKPTPATDVVTKSSTEVQSNCFLPPHPKFGKWSIVGKEANSLSRVGFVTNGTILMLRCNEGYHLEGANVSVCVSAIWTSSGGCFRRFCPPILSTPEMKVTCVVNDTETDNCINATDGTLAKFECAPYYENLGLERRPTHVCQNGTWDQPTPNCAPECGQFNTTNTEIYPWQVQIRRSTSKSWSCEGSLLSQKIVLTAAACMINGRGFYIQKENFTVVAGISEGYPDRTQYSTLQDILIPDEFSLDKMNSGGDIAILVLEHPFKLSGNVRPVCIDLSQTLKWPRRGYGYIPSKSFLNVSTYFDSECEKMVELAQAKYLLGLDKFCVSTPRNTIPPPGSGIFDEKESRYYIVGVASAFAIFDLETTKGILENVALYTVISKHQHFIVPQLAKYKT